MNRIKLWPHGVLIVLGVAVVAGIAAAVWFRYERSAQASGLPNAARIERVDGQVGVNRSLDSETNSQWIEARANTPVSVGDRIYTKENSRTDIAFTGRNAATRARCWHQTPAVASTLRWTTPEKSLALRCI